MYVYRVEHVETKIGPYHHVSGLSEGSIYGFLVMDRNHSDRKHPSSYDDCPEWEDSICYEDGRHGFASVESLMRWFDDCEQKLEEYGFVINRYNVPDYKVVKGHFQVVYDRFDVVA